MVGILSVCMSVYQVYAMPKGGQKRASDAPGTRVTEGSEPCGCWESNPAPLEEQPMLLAEGPSPQALYKKLR